MNFSLALGGGAARGLAHIGVIRYLEEFGLRPDAIAGTSMGAIIGTLLAIGNTSHEMEAIIKNITWLKLIDPDLKKGLLKGEKVEEFLDTLFSGKTFSETDIPLTITATNIDTGEGIIFREGKLSSAVRASISLPGVFIPKTINSMDCVDGGLANNLPIEQLPEGKVIAVSALRDLTRSIRYEKNMFGRDWSKSIFGNTYSIIQKTIDIMLAQNEARSIASRSDVTYIRPKFDGLDYYEFDKYERFILAGYAAASMNMAGFSHENQ